jgi:hypothetical protein
LGDVGGFLDTVYLLQHHHALGSRIDMKLIGVYGTEAGARAAQLRMQGKPGFIDCPEGFRIESYVLNKEYWVEGCVTG